MAATAEKLETPQHELIIVDSSPAEISVNYESVKASLETELKKYDVIVTGDTVTDAKRLATELNKNATEFNRLRKDAVEKVSGPIRTFEGQMKELSQMCKDGRQKLLDQIAVFERETLNEAKKQMLAVLDVEWSSRNVSDEFRKATIDDLVKLTAVTAKGNLTAKVKGEINTRAQADKSLQDQTDMRLLKLENQSYKAGLAAPLTRAHVESFLFDSDEGYQSRLDAMLESEKERQAVAEKAVRESLNKEAALALPIVEKALDEMVDEVVQQIPEAITPEQETNVVQLQTSAPAQEAPDAIVQPAIEYGYGPIDNMSKIRFETATRSQIEAKAIAEFPEGDVGIWTQTGLVVEIKRHNAPVK